MPCISVRVKIYFMIGVEVILVSWPYTGSIKKLHVKCINKET